MADLYLLENGSDHYLLEDGSGSLRLETDAAPTDVFFENQVDQITLGMKANTAANMGGVLVE
jgi:hypothetical protein